MAPSLPVLRSRPSRHWSPGEERAVLDGPGDHVDEDTEQRERDDEDGPPCLRPAAVICSAEVVREHEDQEVDPNHETEEDEHRPDDVEKRIRASEHGHTFRWGVAERQPCPATSG